MNDPLDMLKNLRRMMQNQQEPEYEIVGTLPPKDLEEWNSLQTLLLKAKNMLEEAQARKSLFWAKMEQKTQIFDRGLKVEDGILFVEKKTSVDKKGIPELPCTGDCDNCEQEH